MFTTIRIKTFLDNISTSQYYIDVVGFPKKIGDFLLKFRLMTNSYVIIKMRSKNYGRCSKTISREYMSL